MATILHESFKQRQKEKEKEKEKEKDLVCRVFLTSLQGSLIFRLTQKT
jgi:hypothetical protein